MQNHFYLQTMGIEVWVKRKKNHTQENDLSQLKNKVRHCNLCDLHKTRTQTVFSRGNEKAALMIVGEAPGFYEDKEGKPFVGKAGQLLNQMLRSIGCGEEDVYIANVIKCRPPENRDPTPLEVVKCSPFLDTQIHLVKPKLLLGLGRFAGHFLMRKPLALNQLRQKLHYYQSFPFVVSYHPAYLLRNPKEKKKAYTDLLWVKEMLESNL